MRRGYCLKHSDGSRDYDQGGGEYVDEKRRRGRCRLLEKQIEVAFPPRMNVPCCLLNVLERHDMADRFLAGGIRSVCAEPMWGCARSSQRDGGGHEDMEVEVVCNIEVGRSFGDKGVTRDDKSLIRRNDYRIGWHCLRMHLSLSLSLSPAPRSPPPVFVISDNLTPVGLRCAE